MAKLFLILILILPILSSAATHPICEIALKKVREKQVLSQFKNEDFVQQCGGTCYFESFKESVEALLAKHNYLGKNEEVSRPLLFLNFAQEWIDHLFLQKNKTFTSSNLLHNRNLFELKDGVKTGIFDYGNSYTDILLLNINIPISVKQKNRLSDEQVKFIRDSVYQMLSVIDKDFSKNDFIGNEALHRLITKKIQDLRTKFSQKRTYHLHNLRRTKVNLMGESMESNRRFSAKSEQKIKSLLDAQYKLEMDLFHDEANPNFKLKNIPIQYYQERTLSTLFTMKFNHTASITGYHLDPTGSIDFLIIKQSQGRPGVVYLASPNFSLNHAEIFLLEYDKLETID